MLYTILIPEASCIFQDPRGIFLEFKSYLDRPIKPIKGGLGQIGRAT